MIRSILISSICLISCCFSGKFSEAQQFIDEGNSLPVENSIAHGIFGAGASVMDVNGDGWDDITLGYDDGSLKLFLNQNGTFEEFPLGLSYTGEVKSILWVDFDNDADKDLFVSVKSASFRLYENIGDLELIDITEAAGFLIEEVENWGCCWGDIDEDGWLDLYVGRYHNQFDGEGYELYNRLYRNNGDGTFEDISLSSGTYDGISYTLQSSFFDYDRDGDIDLYNANDKWHPNRLYRNEGDGLFSDVSGESDTGIVIDAMSVTAGDYDNDGFIDIYVTNVPFGGNVLLHNNGDGSFTNNTEEQSVGVHKFCWGANWIDVDNDGWQDLYVASQSAPSGISNHFFINNGGNLEENLLDFFPNDTANTYSTCVADFNNDGFPDLIGHNSDPFIPNIWMNQGNEHHYLKVQLEGIVSNRDAIGTIIEVYIDGAYQMRQTYAGENYIGQNASQEIFGLGESSSVDSLIISWPNGLTEKYFDIDADQEVIYIEGQTLVLTLGLPEVLNICEGDSIELIVSGFESYLWSNGQNGESTFVTAEDVYWLEATNSEGFTLTSDSVSIEFYPPIAFNLTTQDISCNDEEDGSILIETEQDLEIIWEGELIGLNPGNLSAGIYTGVLTDLEGCSIGLDIEITEPPELAATLEFSESAEPDEGWAIVFPEGGTPEYEILWCNGSNELSADDLAPGDCSVIITDANGCTWNAEFYIELASSIEENNTKFSIWPNPTSGIIHSKGLQEGDYVALYRNDGVILFSQEYNIDDSSMDFTGMPQGIYFLQVRRTKGTFSFKVMIH